ncbi:ABC transporter substrate-binding protein [Candidatus Halocynthiibacter alkanivorans]|uniref:ABC transporter substrate-binding protein n=1 Tax=Candidatus Halocynthiibacter alkanivorans TaxID=2267619 RepID=UPI000DF3A773|nr:ABC transporter substrate-binding protein [Candidatus Halocynthiibacter alkanivorans]
MKTLLLSVVALTALASGASAAVCPAVTVADMMGVGAGAYPQQYELSEFETLADCTLEFSANPEAAALNARIRGNGDLPPLADRLPSEPLVVAPYDAIGTYGGTLDVLSNATEAGTSDFLSVRHVNLVRFSDDLQTIVPNVAKGWEWNEDFTQLTFFLREGHKWSDGAPFTSADVKYWYDNLALNPDVIAKPKDYVLVSGERMTVDTPDAQTVVFNLPAPKPGLLAHFATSFAQGFQPKHFLGKWDPKLNPDADAEAQAAGFENGLAVLSAYFGNSDWTDTPSPLLNSPEKVANLPADVVPTLESHITIADTTEGRRLVANPYFFQVDTQGNQLPYISEQDEVYINENEVRILKLVNSEVDYKSQSLQLPSAPLLLENQENGDYTVELKPEITIATFGFNVTSEDLEKRKVFGDLRFRQAMSVALNRVEINETAFFGLGEPKQYIGFSPAPNFVDAKWSQYMAQYDPDMANSLLDEIGMKDTDGDGFRELPNGERLVINLQFATQGLAGQVVELVGQNWSEVGIQTTVKEVTPDEYRSAQSSNQLDVAMWRKGQPMGIVLGNNELWVPPFENYFGSRVGMLWAEWVDSDGASGVEPPEYVKQLIADINAFQSTPAGTPESDVLGARLVENLVSNLLFIGTVQAPAPVYHRNALKNFTEFKTQSYEYYRTYPYRATQWFLDE